MKEYSLKCIFFAKQTVVLVGEVLPKRFTSLPPPSLENKTRDYCKEQDIDQSGGCYASVSFS